MAIGLAWLAYSERERQQALDVSRALLQRESVDELGVGSIRDGISNLLFPGTSTLQTRARYFFFIPWAYQSVRGVCSPQDVRRQVRRAEERLIEELIEHCPTDELGLIGR